MQEKLSGRAERKGNHMKLTNKIKDSIVDQASSEKFNPLRKAAEENLIALYYKHAEEAGLLKFDDVPHQYQDYIGRASGIRFQCKNGSDIIVNDPDMAYCIPNDQRQYYSGIRIDRSIYYDNEPETIAYKQLDEQAAQFRKDVRSILAAVNTDKQLTAVCPELCKYLPTVEDSNGVLVPIDLINRVRNQLK